MAPIHLVSDMMPSLKPNVKSTNGIHYILNLSIPES